MYSNPFIQQPGTYNTGGMYGSFGQRAEIVRVNGRNGAEAYNLPANSSVLLLDESQPLVWLKQTDGAGYPTITPYKIEPYVPENPMNSLEARIKKLEELYESNFKSANGKPEQ